MKRIIPILVALCFVVAMAVPAFAAENEYTVSGVWVFNDTLLPYGTSSPQTVNFVIDNIQFVSMFPVNYSDNMGLSYLFCYGVSDSNNMRVWENGYWIDEDYCIVDFGSIKQTVSFEFYTWLTANANFTPPPPGPLVEVMTDLQEQNQLSQVLSQVLTIIPIGLVCWVGYRGLRKALALLQKILHRA